MAYSSLTFTLHETCTSSSSAARAGLLSFTRPSDGTHLIVETPGLITTLEKGVIPNIETTNRARLDLPAFVHSSLDTTYHISTPTPLSTLLPCSTTPFPLHTHLLLPPSSTILSLSLRNPTSHLLPPNNRPNKLSLITASGFQYISPKTYYDSALQLKPDVVWAAADTRAGVHPGGANAGVGNGKKAEGKGVQRTLGWLRELVDATGGREGEGPALWTELVGGTDPYARSAFVVGLLSSSSSPTTLSLDSRLSGYTLPLPTLRHRLSPPSLTPLPSSYSQPSHHPLPSSLPDFIPSLVSVLQPSLAALPKNKPRLAAAALSPHEILALVGDLGVDLFDGTLAYECTEMGVALNFRFPVPEAWVGGEEEVGINLYDPKYELDFAPLGGEREVGEGSLSAMGGKGTKVVGATLVHCPSSGEELAKKKISEAEEEFFSRAYVHHLLMAHELLAPIALQSHNLAVLQSFLRSIRSLLLSSPSSFDHERRRFEAYYSGSMSVLLEGRRGRKGVKRERGKGSMGKDRSGGGKGEGSGSEEEGESGM